MAVVFRFTVRLFVENLTKKTTQVWGGSEMSDKVVRSTWWQEYYKDGLDFSITTTIDSDLIPLSGSGALLEGRFAATGESATLIDFSCGIGVNPLGYNGELQMMPGNEWFNPNSVILKKELCRIAPVPMPVKVFLCNSGTEAVEAAIKMCMARRYREANAAKLKSRQKFLLKKNVFGAFGGAFHGRTLGALSLNCSKKRHTEAFFGDHGDMSDDGRFKMRAIPVCHIPFPEQDNTESHQRFYEVIEKVNWFQMNAFFLELVQGEGGIRVIDRVALAHLVDRCRDNGVYVIADEVQTGMMRTGQMFACNHFNLMPDIICLSKALGGGQTAIGATVANARFDFEKPGQHSNTFGGSPGPSKRALENITKLEALDRHLLDERIAILSEFAPQGLGLMRRIVFELSEERDMVCEKALHRGVLVIPAGERAIRLMPPLNIPGELLIQAIEILKSCIKEVVG